MWSHHTDMQSMRCLLNSQWLGSRLQSQRLPSLIAPKPAQILKFGSQQISERFLLPRPPASCWQNQQELCAGSGLPGPNRWTRSADTRRGTRRAFLVAASTEGPTYQLSPGEVHLWLVSPQDIDDPELIVVR